MGGTPSPNRREPSGPASDPDGTEADLPLEYDVLLIERSGRTAATNSALATLIESGIARRVTLSRRSFDALSTSAESGVTLEGVWHIGQWEFRPDDRTMWSPDSGRVALTVTETRFLQMLLTHRPRTVSRSDLLTEVFVDARHPSTVDCYVHSLRMKTERGLIVTVSGLGYTVNSE